MAIFLRSTDWYGQQFPSNSRGTRITVYVRAIGDESNCFSVLVDNTLSEGGKASYERERFVKSIRAKHTHRPGHYLQLCPENWLALTPRVKLQIKQLSLSNRMAWILQSGKTVVGIDSTERLDVEKRVKVALLSLVRGSVQGVLVITV